MRKAEKFWVLPCKELEGWVVYTEDGQEIPVKISNGKLHENMKLSQAHKDWFKMNVLTENQ